MQKSENRVVLSKNPYLQRTRIKEEFDRFSNMRPSPRPERRTVELKTMQNSELEAKLLAVCDSLQAKNIQCRFLIQENEYLNQRLLELTKGKSDTQKLEVASEGTVPISRDKENFCCQELKKELNNAIQLNEQLQRQRRQSVGRISISTKSIQASYQETNQRPQDHSLKQQVTDLTQQISKQKAELQAIIDDKNNMIEMLNTSLLGAIETSSKLMGEKCELSQKLEQSSNALKEIESLYVNAKSFIFKGMESNQPEDDANQSTQEDPSQLELFRRQLSEKERDLQATRYLLDVKIKQCQDKQQTINSLKHFEIQCGRLDVVVKKLAQELMEFKKLKSDPANEDKLSRAFTTIQNQVNYCRKAFQFYQNLSSNAAFNKCKAGQTIKRRYEQFRISIAQQFDQICSSLIVKKMEIDRFTKQLYSELKAQGQ